MGRTLQFLVTLLICLGWVAGPGVEIAQAQVTVDLTHDLARPLGPCPSLDPGTPATDRQMLAEQG